MPTRRAVLSAIGLAMAGTAGCLDGTDDEPSASASGDASGLGALPEPHLEGDRQFHVVADVDLAGLRESQGPLTEQDGDLGEQAQSFVEEFPQFDPSGLDRITGQLVAGTGGRDEVLSAVVTGDVDADAVENWVDETTADDYETGEYEGYDWYAPEDALVAVGADHFLVHVTGRPGESPASLAETVVDAAASEGHWFDDEQLVDTVDDLASHPNVVAGSVAPGTLENPGESIPVEELAAAGLGTTPGPDGADVELLAQFHADPDADAFRSLVEGYTTGLSGTDPVVAEFEYSQEDDAVRASATVDADTLSASQLAPVLRFPPFLFFGQLSGPGRDQTPPPQVSWDMDQHEDGRLEITHAAGDSIRRDLTITYVADGESVEETWSESEPITAGTSYVTSQAGDQGTRLQIHWTDEGGESHLLGEHVFV